MDFFVIPELDQLLALRGEPGLAERSPKNLFYLKIL